MDSRSWYNKSSDEPAADQKPWEQTSVQWRRRYWLKIDRGMVETLSARATGQLTPVFLTGTSANDDEVWDLFEEVIFLKVSNDTLRRRLGTRTANDYGKHPEDLKDVLRWNETAAADNDRYGAMIVDAEPPVDQVVDEILRLTSADKEQPRSGA
jgi:hypothetical protein